MHIRRWICLFSNQLGYDTLFRLSVVNAHLFCRGAMRAVLLYLATITVVIWMASDGRVDRDHLPIINSRAPTHISNLPLPDLHDLNNLSVVPAAQAGGAYFEEVYVQGSLVNVRSGPGLSYRMIDVLEGGDQLEVDGDWRGDWAPVYDPATGLNGWIHGAYITTRSPR